MRIKEISDSFFSLLYPDRCPGCNEVLPMDQNGFCPKCTRRIIIADEPACKRCGRLLYDDTVSLCRECIQGEHEFIQNKSYCLYEGPAKKAMYRFKYNGAAWAGRAFSKGIVSEHIRWFESIRVQAVIPVPMYPGKERIRGYNQARILAENIVKILQENEATKDIILTDPVSRGRSTVPQKDLSVSIRRKNLKKAFKLKKNVVKLRGIYSDRDSALYNRVLLVDDIFTTGATLDAVSQLLIEGKIAREVYSVTAVTGSV